MQTAPLPFQSPSRVDAPSQSAAAGRAARAVDDHTADRDAFQKVYESSAGNRDRAKTDDTSPGTRDQAVEPAQSDDPAKTDDRIEADGKPAAADRDFEAAHGTDAQPGPSKASAANGHGQSADPAIPGDAHIGKADPTALMQSPGGQNGNSAPITANLSAPSPLPIRPGLPQDGNGRVGTDETAAQMAGKTATTPLSNPGAQNQFSVGQGIQGQTALAMPGTSNATAHSVAQSLAAGETPASAQVARPETPLQSLQGSGLLANAQFSDGTQLAKGGDAPVAQDSKSATTSATAGLAHNVGSKPTGQVAIDGLQSAPVPQNAVDDGTLRSLQSAPASQSAAETSPSTSVATPAALPNAARIDAVAPVPIDPATPAVLSADDALRAEMQARGDAETNGLNTVAGQERGDTQRSSQFRLDVMRPESMRAIGQQMIESVQTGRNGSFDIALNPEELGRIRMTFTPSENGMHLNLTGERAETLDLLRRHINELQQEFAELGYGEISFEFGTAEHSGGSESNEEQTRTGEPASEERAETFNRSNFGGSAAGLDLRI